MVAGSNDNCTMFCSDISTLKHKMCDNVVNEMRANVVDEMCANRVD